MDDEFKHAFAEVNGVRLHYVEHGSGDPLVLLPAWPRTWWQYRELLARLSGSFRVIVVEFRGMGQSDKPLGGYDKKTMASDVRALTRLLGYERVNIAGEDIGGMVAYSFAANFPEATERVAVLEAVHPSESLYQFPMLPIPGVVFPWWWALAQVPQLPEELFAGKYRLMIDQTIAQHSDCPDTFSEHDRELYAAAYDTPDAIRASNSWFSSWMTHDIPDEKAYQPIQAPFLALNGRLASITLPQLEGKVTNLQSVEIEGGGHFLVEEHPAEVCEIFERFFGDSRRTSPWAALFDLPQVTAMAHGNM